MAGREIHGYPRKLDELSRLQRTFDLESISKIAIPDEQKRRFEIFKWVISFATQEGDKCQGHL